MGKFITDIIFLSMLHTTIYISIYLSKLLVHWLARVESSLHGGTHVGSIHVSVHKSVLSLRLSVTNAHREIGSDGFIKEVCSLVGLFSLNDTVD